MRPISTLLWLFVFCSACDHRAVPAAPADACDISTTPKATGTTQIRLPAATEADLLVYARCSGV